MDRNSGQQSIQKVSKHFDDAIRNKIIPSSVSLASTSLIPGIRWGSFFNIRLNVSL